MCASKKEYTIKSDWLGSFRKRPLGENMTAVEVLSEQNTAYIDELVKNAAREFQEQMDFSILADLFKEDGWVEIKFNPRRVDIEASAIKEWLEQNCKGNRMSLDNRWLFQNETDAVMFALKWPV